MIDAIKKLRPSDGARELPWFRRPVESVSDHASLCKALAIQDKLLTCHQTLQKVLSEAALVTKKVNRQVIHLKKVLATQKLDPALIEQEELNKAQAHRIGDRNGTGDGGEGVRTAHDRSHSKKELGGDTAGVRYSRVELLALTLDIISTQKVLNGPSLETIERLEDEFMDGCNVDLGKGLLVF